MAPRLAMRPAAPSDSQTGAASTIPQPATISESEVAGYKEQDALLPIATVARIMRKSLPDEAKLSKPSRECLQECVSEFISFITSEAAERAYNEKRRTLTGDDILTAFNTLGFENYAEVATIYLSKYRVWLAETQKKGNTERKRKTPKGKDKQDSIEPEDDPSC